MSTPVQLTEAIGHASAEIAELQHLANEVPLLQVRLNNTSAQIHLGTATVETLTGIQDKITRAIAARRQPPRETVGAHPAPERTGGRDRHAPPRGLRGTGRAVRRPQGRVRRQVARPSRYFRQLHSLHAGYLGMTGRPLLHNVDYLLMLPSTMKPFDSPQHSTGSIVRAAPLRMVA